MKAEFDPVTLATPFFILSIILEIVLARMGKADARYETKDTAGRAARPSISKKNCAAACCTAIDQLG